MPIACDPNRTTAFSLLLDEQLPEDQRPVFRSRFMTGRQRDAVRATSDEASELEKAGKIPEMRAKLAEALRVGIVGWERLKTPDGEEIPSLTFDRLPDALSDEELWELTGRMLVKTTLGERDAKNSVSLSLSDAAHSAPTADVTATAGNV